MKSLVCLLLFACAGGGWASPLPETSQELASNTVTAVYRGTFHRTCKGRTALCPDRCGHSGSVARFDVLSNEGYTRSGRYGDERLEPGAYLMVNTSRPEEGQSEEVTSRLGALEPGDTVRLTVTHYYVNGPHAFYPIRPVTKLELLEEKKTVEPLTPNDDPAAGIMPLVR